MFWNIIVSSLMFHIFESPLAHSPLLAAKIFNSEQRKNYGKVKSF